MEYFSILMELIRMQDNCTKKNQLILHLSIFTYQNQNSIEANWIEEKKMRIGGVNMQLQ